MADPLQIIVTTETDRFIFENVVEVLIKPYDGGLELRQNKDGWDLKPREEKHEESIQMEQAQVHAEPAGAGRVRRNWPFNWLRICPVGTGLKEEK